MIEIPTGNGKKFLKMYRNKIRILSKFSISLSILCFGFSRLQVLLHGQTSVWKAHPSDVKFLSLQLFLLFLEALYSVLYQPLVGQSFVHPAGDIVLV
jgi:hypothetical protein